MIHILLQRKDFATIEQMSEEFSELWEKFIPPLLTKNDHKKQRRLKRKYHFFRLLSAILFIIILYLIVGR